MVYECYDGDSDEEYNSFMKTILYDTDKELLMEFIHWYARHYGYLINSDNVDIFLKENK